MDVDEAEVEIEVTPAPDEQAHRALAAQFTPFPFTHHARNSIFTRRALMSDELVLDLLLEQASIASPHSLFPPDSLESLLQLLDAIAQCPWDSLKKSSLHFYLLSHVSPTVAAKHAAACALPPPFVNLAHACFLLDSGSPDDLSRAVALLSDTRIVQDLSSKILHTLSLAPQPASSSLIRTYVRTAQPVLESYDDLAIYIRALMDCSLADAWTFQRTFSEPTPIRNQLIRTILDGCLIPPKPAVLPHLLSLPLTSFEFSLLQSYALSPPDELTLAAHSILQDLITVRLLHSGKYSDAIRLSRAFDTLNAKSRTGNTAPLHKASEERQQMMRDILAVVPEVQRRQLEIELNDEQVDGENASLGTSWASMGSDPAMSWENLAASGSMKSTLASSRSGRLEGSPAPTLPGRVNTPNAPFGLFSSPAISRQRPRANAHPTPNIFGTPTPAGTLPPALPTIPTPGLATSMAGWTPSGFPPAKRFSFGNTPPHQSQNGIAPQQVVALNVHNPFYKPEPPRGGTSLFGLQQQDDAGSALATPKARVRTVSGGEPTGVDPEATLEDDRDQQPAADLTMVDSDDPDAFVVRGRRRISSFRPSRQTADVNAEAEGYGGTEKSSENVGLAPGTTLFGRHKEPTQGTDQSQHTSPPRAKILPGGLMSVELREDTFGPPREPLEPIIHDPPRQQRSPRPARRRSRRKDEPETKMQEYKIPGAFQHEEGIEAGEVLDSVPSLPSAPSRGARRTRASRASSVSGDEEDAPRASLRRSSRLSSAGPSPEPSSPQKPERKSASKRTTRAAAVVDGSGRPMRKRKNAED